jgi:hypothetical protein
LGQVGMTSDLAGTVCGSAQVNDADRRANPLTSLGARGSTVDADPHGLVAERLGSGCTPVRGDLAK